MKHKTFYTSFFVCVIFSLAFNACSQDGRKYLPVIQHRQYWFGSSVISIKETRYEANHSFQLVLLHSDETTAGEVAKTLSDELAIDFIQIENDRRRLIDVETVENKFRFDPNRMFSKEGITASLNLHSRFSEIALNNIDSFGVMFLNLLDSGKTIIALHNNKNDAFTLASYSHNQTGLVHQNPMKDVDDFFITTDSTLYQRLKEKDFNVVWEWSNILKDDGSLSIYCSRNNIRYVNIEAEHGDYKEQSTMLKALIEILK